MPTERFRSDEACAAINDEFEMFTALGGLLISSGCPRPGTFEHHALVDSFLLHARALRDFFYHEGHRSEDLVAAQFVPNWKLIRPLTSKYVLTHKQSLDQRLGRLTVKRVQAAGSLDVKAIESELTPLIGLFRSSLPAELKGKFDDAACGRARTHWSLA